MDLKEIEKYWLNRLKEIDAINTDLKNKNPWVHLCLATYINYLANLTIETNKNITNGRDKDRYIRFIRDYLSNINKDYLKKLKIGATDYNVEDLLYDYFRSGLVHSMSLKAGRKISILHKEEAKKEKVKHLQTVIVEKNNIKKKVVLLVAEDLIDDLISVTKKIFLQANINSSLKKRIQTYMTNYPPVEGGWAIIEKL